LPLRKEAARPLETRATPVFRRLASLLGYFDRPRARRRAIGVALLLVAPTLFSGFALDDYVLLYRLGTETTSQWVGNAPFDLFRWLDPTHIPRLMDGQGMPWWTFDHASCAFMRPLSSLTHAIDHWLWPHSALLMHAHSLLWFALLLFVTAKAYSRLIETRWVGGVACALFALDSAHGEAVGWISNRNALIAGVFALATLIAHDRWRRTQRAHHAMLAGLCLAAALLSGELAVGVVGYLASYALLYERGSLRARMASLLPYGFILAFWAATRAALGYGSYGLGAYVDPIREPATFASVLPERALVLMSSQIVRAVSEYYSVMPAALQPLALLGALAVSAAFAWFAWPALCARRSMRFWAGGAALSLLPLAATVPGDRLLTLVGVGVMPVMAQAMIDALTALQGARATFAAILAVVHFAIDPLMLPLLGLAPAVVGSPGVHAEATLPAAPAIRNQVAVVVGVPDSAVLSYVPTMRSLNGRPEPEKLYWLAAMPGELEIERRAPDVLRVTSDQGLFDRRSESRSPSAPLRRGDRVELSEMTVDVVALNASGQPYICDFHFSAPLEAQHYVWLAWDGKGLRHFELPAVGETKQVTVL
jgi:hypothetical protein